MDREVAVEFHRDPSALTFVPESADGTASLAGPPRSVHSSYICRPDGDARTRSAEAGDPSLRGTSEEGRDHTVLNGIAIRLRQSLVLPVLLILAGVLSFAGMLGYIDAASARTFVRMWWPAVLVLIGLEIMVARMRR